MKYFIDTEFLEGPQRERFPISLFRKSTLPTIDLISIGIVSEDGREYYAISKDFNLREAWNRFDLKIDEVFGDQRNRFPKGIKRKEYWLRENVLYPIYLKLLKAEDYRVFNGQPAITSTRYKRDFSLKTMEYLLKTHGKTNSEIAIEIQEFVYGFAIKGYDENETQKETTNKLIYSLKENIEFYAYYADYDWVVFCWLFGKMMDLPKGFPMYCFDIQQQIHEHGIDKEELKNKVPQINSHNALSDAKWNMNAYLWIKKNIDEKRRLFIQGRNDSPYI